MKIVITGSLGHISHPLAQELIEKGHTVTVISSKPEKQEEIEALGAKSAIGNLKDSDFLSATFAGADAVYTMIPPGNYMDQNLNIFAHYHEIGNNYAKAIAESGVKRVVNLSTIGAHMKKDSGILLGAHDVEGILNQLPLEVSIKHMRPTSFYYNLFGYVDMIKHGGVIAANYGADHTIPWVSPTDIATAVVEELLTPSNERKVRYVASEELTGDETANILGAAIGKPDLKWVLISNEETENGLRAIGMNHQIAAGLVEMYGSLYNGKLAEDYNLNKPEVMGKVKLVDFAEEFAVVFNQK